jgi:hypothetical protein
MGKHNKTSLAALIVLIATMSMGERAMAMRCGNKLVLRGDHQAKILRYCGDPTHILQRAIYRSGPTRQFTSRHTGDRRVREALRDDEILISTRSIVEVLIEEWTYNLGPRKLMRVVRFENGIVTDVRHLGYGYRE